MFSTIFSFEFKRWLKNPSFYVYIVLFFFFSLLMMGASIGLFDSFSVTTSSNAKANSPIALNNFVNGLSIFIYFLLPTIIGASVYRDFKYNTHTILYSYPFTKLNYLAGKFLSSLTIVFIITIFVGVSSYAAAFLPGVNTSLLTDYSFSTYIHIYLVYIIPNLFLYGAIVFAVVTLTRNVYIGFITIIVLLVIQALIGNLTADIDNQYLAALFEPFGSQAIDYYTKYWSVEEQNVNPLPIENLIIYNRLFWFAIAGFVLFCLYKYFSFTQTALTLGKGKKGERTTKENFGSITKITLPGADYRFSFLQNLKTTWYLSKTDFKYIIKNWIFASVLIVGLVFILISATTIGQIYGTKTLPATWQMLLIPGNFFSLFINLLTFLFSGLLIHRGQITRMNHLVDSTPVPNWVLMISKLIALVKMQMVLLSVILISGMLIQIYNGYYHFEIGHYLFELYGIKLIHFVIWGFISILIHTLLKNYLFGFFVLLIISMLIPFLSSIGIEQIIYKYNQDSGYSYSDMNGYGHTLPLYYLYKLYWVLLGIAMLCTSLVFWRRGLTQSVKERFSIAKSRFTKPIALFMILGLGGFLAIGSSIYYETRIKNTYVSSKDYELQRVAYEQLYKNFESISQPRIIDVYVAVDMYPETRDFSAKGKFLLQNKSDEKIDSILINYRYDDTKISFNIPAILQVDSIHKVHIYTLEKSVLPGDSLVMNFEIKNKPNTIVTNNSPILANGTFFNSTSFPIIGYAGSFELQNNKVREKYGLPEKELMAEPTDSIARRNTYISSDADWISFETVISTALDQTAIAPGYLEKNWQENGRNYFHYKMDQKMLNFYAFNSGKYQVKRDKWKDVNIEIYYHEPHVYNLDRMVDAIKASLDYYTENFSPYQHKQVRIIEFPATHGTFAQSFANTIPFSEAIGFIADIDDEDEESVDYAFSVTSHEVAHQWWAHQVIGANVQGATLLSESLSEYSSLKVLEHRYGKKQMRKFLKDALDKYLTGRTFERTKEKPLMYNENQQYIHYNKGSLVLYALSDFIGEKTMNNALKDYISEVAFQEQPFTNSIELVNHLRKVTPDTLQYLIEDMFETITIYDNKVNKANYTVLDNGKYEVTIEAQAIKYRSDEQGKRIFEDEQGNTLTSASSSSTTLNSYPMNDYIEIGVFGEEKVDGKTKEKELYLKKVKVNSIENTYKIIVDEKPIEVGIDPYNKLIDIRSTDNRMKL